MKPYLIIFNKEITDVDKLFGFQIMKFYDYSYSDFEAQPISQSDLKVLSKAFEFDYDPSSGDSPSIGAFPNAIEQLYDEYPDVYEDEEENDYEDDYR